MITGLAWVVRGGNDAHGAEGLSEPLPQQVEQSGGTMGTPSPPPANQAAAHREVNFYLSVGALWGALRDCGHRCGRGWETLRSGCRWDLLRQAVKGRCLYKGKLELLPTSKC